MPNHVTNRLTITGDEQSLSELLMSASVNKNVKFLSTGMRKQMM